MEGDCGSPESSNAASHHRGSDQHLHLSNDSFTSGGDPGDDAGGMAANDMCIAAEECDKFRVDLETRCVGGRAAQETASPKRPAQAHNDSHSQFVHNDNNNGGVMIGRKDSQSSIEREIIQLNKEMEMIQMECQEIVEAHSHRQQERNVLGQPGPQQQKQQQKGQGVAAAGGEAAGRPESYRSPRMVPRMGTRLDYMKQMLAAQEAAQMQMHGQPNVYPQQLPGFPGAGTDPANPLWMMRQNEPQHLNATNHVAKDISLKPKEIQQLVSGGHSGDDRDTSNTSAYNTGDSCRSTPLTLELSSAPAINGHKGSLLSLSVQHPSNLPHVKPSYSDSEKMTQTGAIAPTNGVGPVSQNCKQVRDWSSDGSESKKLRQFLPGQYRVHPANGGSPGGPQGSPVHPTTNLSKSMSNGSFSEKTSQTPNGDLSQTENADSLQELYAQYADVMYTNRANLEHTIMVQQKLFQQQLMQRSAHARLQENFPQDGAAGASTASAAGVDSLTPLPSTSIGGLLPPSPSGTSSHMEWVVKRRADGSRYITRRPIRNKILKERAKKIQEERCGMTTDDDAVSEMKVGRYWTKDERKKHLEKVREHKKRKQEMLKSRMETVKENEEEKKKEPNIVELSHRKMMKHKSKRVFDDFTTVQEMMAHGSREAPVNQKGYNPLLSVTTV